MTKKVQLAKEVCYLLDKAFSAGFTNVSIFEKSCAKGWRLKEYAVLNNIDNELLMRALVLGYEPELTAEEKTK